MLMINLPIKAYLVSAGRPPKPPAQPKAPKKADKKPRKKKSRGYLSATTAAYRSQEGHNGGSNEDEELYGYSQPRNGELTDSTQSDGESESESADYHGMFMLLSRSPTRLFIIIDETHSYVDPQGRTVLMVPMYGSAGMWTLFWLHPTYR
jgi:hypothetical protein